MAKLEVHEHSYIAGPRRGGFSHSHEGGDKPHEHVEGAVETGPGCYTIDKDEWYARTGMRGGGRKKFTVKPTGVQIPLIAREPSKIRVFIVGDGGASVAGGGSGPGLAVVDRMVLAFGAEVESFEHVPSGAGRARAV